MIADVDRSDEDHCKQTCENAYYLLPTSRRDRAALHESRRRLQLSRHFAQIDTPAIARVRPLPPSIPTSSALARSAS